MEHEDMRGTMNDNILEYYDNLTILLDCIMLYTKPVHILGTSTEKITCTKKVKYWIRKRRNWLKLII